MLPDAGEQRKEAIAHRLREIELAHVRTQLTVDVATNIGADKFDPAALEQVVRDLVGLELQHGVLLGWFRNDGHETVNTDAEPPVA